MIITNNTITLDETEESSNIAPQDWSIRKGIQLDSKVLESRSRVLVIEIGA